MRWGHNTGLVTLACIATLTTLTACKQRGSALPAEPTSQGSTTPGTPSQEVTQPDKADPSQAVFKTLRAMSVRRNCNRVMGCKPSITLLQYGPSALAPIARFVTENPRLDKWWLVKVIDVVGQIRDEASAAILSGLLTDWRPELRARAALGLARLHFPSSRQPIEKAISYWKERTDSGDPATRGALAYAMERTSGRVTSPEYKRYFLAQWPKTRGGNHKTIAPVIGLLCEVARDWHLKEALPFVRHSLDHPSPFARAEAIRAVGALRDKASIPSLIDRLKDVQPSQRRLALGALTTITGNRGLVTHDEWTQWCARRRCREAAGAL